MIRRALAYVVFPVLFGYSLGACLTGCAPFVEDVKEAQEIAVSNDTKLSKCRGDARAAYYIDRKTVEESLAVYEDCKRREGLK